jgi:hypothetical protein
MLQSHHDYSLISTLQVFGCLQAIGFSIFSIEFCLWLLGLLLSPKLFAFLTDNYADNGHLMSVC